MSNAHGHAGRGSCRSLALWAALGVAGGAACSRSALVVLAADAAPGCRTVEQDLTRFPAELLVVLDRSRSMGRQLPGMSNTLFQDVVAALDETAGSTAGVVRFGLKLFPTVGGCEVADGVEVVPQDDPGAMRATLRAATTVTMGGGGSPIQGAVRRATAYVRQHRTQKLQYLVLATDGAPTCGATSAGDDTEGTVQALRDAAVQGLHTFVVGIAIEGSKQQAALDQMAVAGGEPRAGAKRYASALDRQELSAALAPIVSYVSCSLPLPGAAFPTDAIVIALDGQAVPRATRATAATAGGSTRRAIRSR